MGFDEATLDELISSGQAWQEKHGFGIEDWF